MRGSKENIEMALEYVNKQWVPYEYITYLYGIPKQWDEFWFGWFNCYYRNLSLRFNDSFVITPEGMVDRYKVSSFLGHFGLASIKWVAIWFGLSTEKFLDLIEDLIMQGKIPSIYKKFIYGDCLIIKDMVFYKLVLDLFGRSAIEKRCSLYRNIESLNTVVTKKDFIVFPVDEKLKDLDYIEYYSSLLPWGYDYITNEPLKRGSVSLECLPPYMSWPQVNKETLTAYPQLKKHVPAHKKEEC